jgi:hypothetical protein
MTAQENMNPRQFGAYDPGKADWKNSAMGFGIPEPGRTRAEQLRWARTQYNTPDQAAAHGRTYASGRSADYSTAVTASSLKRTKPFVPGGLMSQSDWPN